MEYIYTVLRPCFLQPFVEVRPPACWQCECNCKIEIHSTAKNIKKETTHTNSEVGKTYKSNIHVADYR